MAFNGQTLPTTQRAVLLAFKARLIEKIGLESHSCFVTDEPMPVELLAVCQPRMVTVCPGPSIYGEPQFEGAGFHDLAERFRVMVTLYQQTRTDQIGHADDALLSETNGMLSVFKRSVLKALLVDDDGVTPVAWMPTDDAGNGLLRNHPMPIACTQPEFAKFGGNEFGEGGSRYVAMSIDWDAFFSWDLLS